MPAADHAVSNRPWIAPTYFVPKISARYAGTVENPPPYIDRITPKNATNSGRVCVAAVHGIDEYSAMPSRKNTVYVTLRPMRSDREAQKIRPAILNSDSNPVNPAASVAICAS